MKRRRYLATLSGAAATALAGCGDKKPSTTTTEQPWANPPAGRGLETADKIADSWRFDNVVNLVDAGADPSGSQPIDDVLADAIEPGTLVTIPAGRYLLEDGFTSDIDRVGIVGDGATIVPSKEFDSTVLGFGTPSPAERLLVTGLTFDFRAENTGGRPLLGRAKSWLLARDLTVLGEADVEQDLFRFDVTTSAGAGLVERLSLPDGAPAGTGVTGIEVGDTNQGDIDFVDCHVAGFPDNGLYADLPGGAVRVLGGTYFNNGIAGIRIEAEDGVVHGAYVRCDDAEGAGENMRGIRLRKGSSLLVENCLVELLEVTSSDGAVSIASEVEGATVRNCHFRVSADRVNAIRVKSASTTASENGPFTFKNVRITGAAADGAGVQVADRNDCTFENIYLHQTGENRNGINADNVDGVLRDSYIAVTAAPLKLSNSNIRQQNVTTDRSAAREDE